jgi:SanA protein
MIKRFSKFLIKFILTLLGLGLLAVFLSRLLTALSTRASVYSQLEAVPSQPVAVVFGAGLLRDGSPTPILRDRVTTAADLYFAGKVQKLLMSGDNRFLYYNEPGAMRKYAIQIGVPPEAIVQDYAGRRTYDTCYRAKVIFGVKSAILVTQAYHLPRALYTCQALGVKVVGVIADRRTYQTGPYLYWNLRELAATLTALWEVNITHPLPVLGEPEPIFPANSQ